MGVYSGRSQGFSNRRRDLLCFYTINTEQKFLYCADEMKRYNAKKIKHLIKYTTTVSNVFKTFALEIIFTQNNKGQGVINEGKTGNIVLVELLLFR